jgi:predicted MPP superfamily phosphohydrolase
MSFDELALVEPLAIGAHGIRRANVQPGEFVLIVGAGPIGLGLMAFARIAGAQVIALDINDTRLAVIGVENYSAHLRFPRHGDLKKASVGTEKADFKVLLSHDPSHWDVQVNKEHPDIRLMLSGHTHGMQFGVEIPGWLKWSPIKYLYKQWAGLYQKDQQYLYVNRGLGFLGYPGRVGILPEIACLELRKKGVIG